LISFGFPAIATPQPHFLIDKIVSTTMSSSDFPADMSQITISDLYWQSIESFQQLLGYCETSNAPQPTLLDDFGRLKVWAENVAAHRRGEMSLDDRLREVMSVKATVKELLTDLNVLEEGK
jgi:hypothetical protein